MKIVVYIGHPAHVHFYSQFAKEMINKGHSFLFLIREKDVTKSLLEFYKLPYISLGRPKSNIISKFFGYFSTSFKILSIGYRFRPDYYAGNGGVYLILSSIIYRKPLLSFSNTDIGPILNLYKYFSSCIITPTSFTKILGKNHLRFSGNFELAYLHPNRFKPDQSVLHRHNIDPQKKIILLRFVSFNAFDDYGKEGISDQEKILIVQEMEKYGHVIISSEKPLPSEIKLYRLEETPNYKTGDLQSLEYFASLFWGDSGAMASECSLLGTPSIYQSSKKVGFVTELTEKSSLCYNYTNFHDALEKARELLDANEVKTEWLAKRNQFLHDKIDVTAFMVWFIENYPESKSTIQQNSDFQKRFMLDANNEK